MEKIQTKKNFEGIGRTTVGDSKVNKISRKEAITKAGLMTLSVATMMILINHPANAQTSPAPPPGSMPSGL